MLNTKYRKLLVSSNKCYSFRIISLFCLPNITKTKNEMSTSGCYLIASDLITPNSKEKVIYLKSTHTHTRSPSHCFIHRMAKAGQVRVTRNPGTWKGFPHQLAGVSVSGLKLMLHCGMLVSQDTAQIAELGFESL